MLKRLLAVYLFFLLAGSGPASADWSDNELRSLPSPRVALVIGNGDYPADPLDNPVNDANAIGDQLEQAGFDVLRAHNLSATGLQQTLRNFSRQLGTSGTVFFYYAGHGITSGGDAFILPVDTGAEDAYAGSGGAWRIDDIVTTMTRGRAGQPNIFVFDACLDQSAGDSSGRSPVSFSSSAQGLLALAAAPGSSAYDGKGQHGVYTGFILQGMRHRDVGMRGLFHYAGQNTLAYTRGQQHPALLASLDGLPRIAIDSGNRATWRELSQMKTRGILPKDGDAQYELEFWQSIKDSKDASDYEAYLEAYPDGRFAPLARARAKRYKTATSPAAAAPPAPPVKTQPAAPKSVSKTPAFTVSAMDEEYDVLSNANVRKLPSSSATRIAELSKGSRVKITGKVNGQNWYRVESRGGTGFVFGDLVRRPAPKPVARPATPVIKSAPKTTSTAPATAAVKALDTLQDCPSCPELVVLPAGSFTMGSSKGDRSERPAHTVKISQSFAIGKTEVTVSQWMECYKAGACSYRPHLDSPEENSPVRDISWSDAREYTRWLSKVTKQDYRLPTEAEWEYAARAGTGTRFWWGNSVGVGHADCKDCGGKWDRKTPREVMAYPANAFGVYGTSGGVWEWVEDCWHKNYQGAPRDGSAWSKSDCRENVIRGGAWRNDSSYIHSASRFKYDSNVRYLLNGFRVARSVDR